jgi:hypothetical protein
VRSLAFYSSISVIQSFLNIAFRFVLTSKQSRKDAATKFVVSIDMLRLGRFPIDLMMQSVAYMVQDVPAIAPSPGEPPCFITEFRMSMDDHQTFPSQSASCHMSLWAEIDHILPYLTSLHTLGPTEPSEDEFSDLVLAKCSGCTTTVTQ